MIGRLHGRRVALMQGRLHLYEGWAPGDIALAVRLLGRLGAARLVVTNAAGALDPEFEPGDVMLIEDHLNFTGANPLTGPERRAVGLRFPDMSRAYDPELRAAARRAAAGGRGRARATASMPAWPGRRSKPPPSGASCARRAATRSACRR